VAGDASQADVPAPAGRPRFVLARDFGERAHEINDLYNAYTGVGRSAEGYRWEWLTGAPGPGFLWTISEESTGRLVGMHGIIQTPMVRRGERFLGGRTENTIIDPSVRRKLFYPGMEKKALGEALQTFALIYTVHGAGPQGKVRQRLGYGPVGLWTVYAPRLGPAYLFELFRRGCARLGWRVPAPALRLAALLAVGLHRVEGLRALRRSDLVVEEVSDVALLAEEYEAFWAEARRSYDLTIDRTLDFLRWRLTDNPHLRFRTWTLRRKGRLDAVVIGHAHRLGGSTALYIDDIIVGSYDEAAFDAVLRQLRRLDPAVDSVVLMTLAVDTPLHRVLRRHLPSQAFLMKRLAPRLFDQLLAYYRDGVRLDEPWYVTPLFTEGLDTSRPG
jgi:hypothetical protein